MPMILYSTIPTFLHVSFLRTFSMVLSSTVSSSSTDVIVFLPQCLWNNFLKGFPNIFLIFKGIFQRSLNSLLLVYKKYKNIKDRKKIFWQRMKKVSMCNSKSISLAYGTLSFVSVHELRCVPYTCLEIGNHCMVLIHFFSMVK